MCVPAVGLGLAMNDLGWMLRREVPIKRAAQDGVDQLEAATDAEDRLPGGNSLLEQRYF